MSSELNIGKVNHFHKANKLSEISFVSWEMYLGTGDRGPAWDKKEKSL
jgi:hypothetical protein